MYYVMSDIHGAYEKYKAMLEQIHFSEEDILFVLGDVVDRGPQPVEILLDMMEHSNIYPIMGNHEVMALYLLEKLSDDITKESLQNLSAEDMGDILEWLRNGGGTTIAGFQKLQREQREAVLDYLAEFVLYEVIDVGENTFILVHAGLGNFDAKKKLSAYTQEELLLTRDDPDVPYFEDAHIFVITGHTPTPYYSGKPEIYRHGQRICIDCGACSDKGKLACLCLDTLEAFYISG